jgi:2-oxoglutarate ferredoxin oxidoreductase subunit alpha
MQRLLRKWDTMKAWMPAPVVKKAKKRTPDGVIFMGSTDPAMEEALETLDSHGIHLDAMRVRGFPFNDDVFAFIRDHEQVFVVEQNRDGQLRSLLIEQFQIDPARLIPILHYDGTPITARFIAKAIGQRMGGAEVTQLRSDKVA